MQTTARIGFSAFAVLLCCYFISYFLTAKPQFNTLFGSRYSAFEYPKIPEYGTPEKLREYGYRNLGIDLEDLVAAIFSPAFELDRRFIRWKFWGGFDYRDVGPRDSSTEQIGALNPIPVSS
ncbi:MAG: hypothetical protein KDM63_20990 [Verrucomicrobiae bacterium]|nr:hypothetical protein [Verrucomicrobiae bacterium]